MPHRLARDEMMTEETQLGAGRRFLMTELKTLWDRSGLSQSDAIRKANQRLCAGEALKPQTVSDWLAGTPAAKFEQLWALVEAFLVVCERRPARADLDRKIKDLRTVLKASGPAVDKAEAQAAMRNLQNADVEWRVAEARWKALWEVARSDPAPGPDPQLGAYLKAASRAAGLPAYPGLKERFVPLRLFGSGFRCCASWGWIRG
ncbi:hypothetical protein [Streptomyces mirabilis]|uniref:hypothetical protein n=1 Tax=Streptomyces mirabilis TaxID=68239 RepID=UPI0033FCCA39